MSADNQHFSLCDKQNVFVDSRWTSRSGLNIYAVIMFFYTKAHIAHIPFIALSLYRNAYFSVIMAFPHTPH